MSCTDASARVLWRSSVLIYGGLFARVLGIATGRSEPAIGWAIAVPGAGLAAVDFVLIYVRSRLKDSS
ncbi:hypothetical protein HLB44_30575 [Aquincola sp. S2]|uniref:DUF4345 domain-containing protein n=1 Tax=Pseudaquabacterium terrae TaxID=2732868 RepID=A0ABX2ES16_9BURK|nr:hypothetical protein [Aquabacterium terrae]